MKQLSLVSLFVLLGSLVSVANVITFDDQGHSDLDFLGNPYSIVNNGETFVFTVSNGGAPIATDHRYRTTDFEGCGNTGLSYLRSGSMSANTWTIETQSGDEIDLGTVRFHNLWGCPTYGNYTINVTIEGFKDGSSTGTQALAVTGGNIIFNSNSNFDQVDKIEITGASITGLGIDDINWEPAVSPCVEPSVPTVSLSPTTVCAGSASTLTISGTLNDATHWAIYSGSCNGTPVGTTATSSFSVTPSAPSTTYYVRGEGGCVTPATCGSASVSVNTLSVAPTGITGTTTICPGESTTLTLAGGTAGTGATAEWFSTSCGTGSIGTGSSITVTPSSSTTYYVRYSGTCNTTDCASTLVTVSCGPSCNPTASFSVARCGSYTVPSGDETHTTSGVYMDTIPSANGCDSVLTINVHIDEVPTITNFTGREVDQFRVRWEYLLPVTINDTNFRIRAWESGFPAAYTDKSQFPGNFQKKFTGLDDNTWYKVKVGFACEDGSFVWSGTDSVRTRKIPCPDVNGQSQVLPYAAHTATVRWNDSGADSYKIRFRASGASDWRFRSVTDTSLYLAGLIVDSSYEYQVKAQCSNGLESSYGEIYNFSTQSIGVDRLSTSPIEVFKAYPNPSDGNLTLEMSTEEVQGLITLIDVAGRTVYSESLMLGPNFRKAFNFEVEQGSYLLQVVSDRLIETAKLEVR